MSNIVKSFLAGAVMSLSRLNQVKDRDAYLESIDEGMMQEEQVRKQEINILSEKRFYDLLNKAEQIHKSKISENVENKLKSRGIEENFLSFKNFKYEAPLHEQLGGSITPPLYKFKTDNDICKYASDVHIKQTNDKLTLNFLVNLNEHPIVQGIAYNLVNLTAFAINENGKIYAYDVTNFEGIIKPTPFEIFLVFEAKCVMNGEYNRELSSETKKMTKDDLIDPKIFKL